MTLHSRHIHVCITCNAFTILRNLLQCVFVTVSEAQDYYIIATSLLNEGPALRCLSPMLFDALVAGPDNVSVSLDDVQHSQLKEDLSTVS